MRASWKYLVVGVALCASVLPASAQRIASPGQTVYFFSGTTADPLNPNIPAGQPGRMGDSVQQTDSILNKLQAMLEKNNLAFSDVIKATVFLIADPAKGNKMDFAGLNSEWAKRFPTDKPRPSRSAIQVTELPLPGALVEIELIAAK
jgi:enamine deaminase RidA (YjgF/YER057c/UK114 family)